WLKPTRKPSSLWLQPSTARDMRNLAAKASRSSRISSTRSREASASTCMGQLGTDKPHLAENPRRFPAGGLISDQIRSGIEVALDTEHARDPVLIAERRAGEGRVEVVVHDLEAQIEVLHGRPHGARADLPVVPVGGAGGARRDQNCAGRIAVLNL